MGGEQEIQAFGMSSPLPSFALFIFSMTTIFVDNPRTGVLKGHSRVCLAYIESILGRCPQVSILRFQYTILLGMRNLHRDSRPFGEC